jgi:hypothetical protein
MKAKAKLKLALYGYEKYLKYKLKYLNLKKNLSIIDNE